MGLSTASCNAALGLCQIQPLAHHASRIFVKEKGCRWKKKDQKDTGYKGQYNQTRGNQCTSPRRVFHLKSLYDEMHFAFTRFLNHKMLNTCSYPSISRDNKCLGTRHGNCRSSQVTNNKYAFG